MGSGKGGSKGSGSYDYFGSIAGVVGEGPFSYISSFIVDGAEVWPRANAWASGQNYAVNNLVSNDGRTWKCTSPDTASSIAPPLNPSKWTRYVLAASGDHDSLTIEGFGEVIIYWGTTTQTAPSLLSSSGNDFGEQHPDYKRICYVLLVNFLFGRERTSAPNIEVIMGRTPLQSVWSGASNALNDGQANMIAAAAEWLTSPNGIGLATDRLDSASFQATAVIGYNKPALAYVSPLLDSQNTVRSAFADVALVTDTFLRFNPNTELIEAGSFVHGSPPSSYHTVTVDDLTEPPKFDAEGWASFKTRAVVSFSDRARAYKQSSDKADDARAFRILGEHRPLSLQRPQITRREQALSHAAETLRTIGVPQLSGSVVVRREKARTFRAGDYVLVDIDLEPGGAELLQFFRIVERSIPRRGPITLRIESEESIAPIPFTPGATPIIELLPKVPAVAHQRIMQTPARLSDGEDTVLALAERPDLIVAGFHCWFDTNPAGTFQRIGTTTTFALRAVLRSNLSDSALTVPITLPAQADTDLILEQPGDLMANDDTLLAFLVEIDSGQVKEDADDSLFIEICSVSAQALVSGSNSDLTVLRGRQSTLQRAFTAAACEVWIIKRESVGQFTHQDFAMLRNHRAMATTPDTGYFRIQPFSYVGLRELSDCSNITMRFPKKGAVKPEIILTAPSTEPVNLTSPTYPASVTFTGSFKDGDSNLTAWKITLR